MQALQVQDKQKLIIRGSADDYHLIQDDIVSVKPVPVELKWSMSDEEFNEYKKAASRFLKDNNEFRGESLRRFLRKNNILVYSLKDASRLLRYKSKNQNLRLNFLIASERNKKMREDSSRDQFGGLLVSPEIFGGFMPLRIIERVSLILRKFPKLYCLISDNNSCSETFVVVTFDKYSEVLVIDMWVKDESDITKGEVQYGIQPA